MISVSSAFLNMMQVRTNFERSAVVTLADQTTISLTNNDFTISGNTLTDAAGGGALPVGTAISRTVHLELTNENGRFNTVSFVDAEVVLTLSYNTGSSTESFVLGTFTVKQPATYGSTVVLDAMDDMYKADHLFETALTYPATAFELFSEICTNTGIQTDAQSIPQGEATISQAPSSQLTYRQVLGYIAMLSGGNARISRGRKLEIINYDFSGLGTVSGSATFTEVNGNVTGEGTFTVTDDGDGNLTVQLAATDSGSGDVTISGGGSAAFHELNLWKNLSSDLEDITITGISTTAETSNGGFDIVTVGQEGNVLTISNPLIAGREQAALTAMWSYLSGATYRPFSGEHVAYPLAEFGDLCHVSDGLGRSFWSVITDMAFTFNGLTTFTASAEAKESTGGGTLSQNVTRISADVADIKRLKVDWADIDTAVINTLETNDITAKNLTVIDDDGNVVATYSGNVVIGKDDETHLEIDFNSLKLIDKEGNTYFYVSDLRDETGYAEVTNRFTGDGTTTTFSFSVPRNQIVSVTIDGVDVSSSDYTTTRNYITFTTAPADSSSIVVVYKSNSPYLKAFSFGRRRSGSLAGLYSYAEGSYVTASGDVSHAEGANTTASGIASHAEGEETTASGEGSHAEGYQTVASGDVSHAEGEKTTASGKFGSHAEGSNTTASGHNSHAEGYDTTASGHNSHAEGDYTTARGGNSHAEGWGTIARGSDQHAGGKFNIEDTHSAYAEIIGNGTSDTNRSNARTLDWNGNEVLAGNLTINGSTDVGAILTALTADTGWKSLNQIYYRKVGRTVFITCSSTASAVSSLPANTWTTVCTIPDGYRPSRRIDSAAVFGYNADVAGDVRISATGVVEVWPSAAVSQPYICFSTSYPV